MYRPYNYVFKSHAKTISFLKRILRGFYKEMCYAEDWIKLKFCYNRTTLFVQTDNIHEEMRDVHTEYHYA